MTPANAQNYATKPFHLSTKYPRRRHPTPPTAPASRKTTPRMTNPEDLLAPEPADPLNWSAYLEPGERILWQGRPHTRVFLFRKHDILLIPFSLLHLIFAIGWNAAVWVAGAPLLFKLFGLILGCASAYFAIGRFFHDSFRRENTRYTLTNRRAFIALDGPTRSLRELRLDTLSQTELVASAPSAPGSLYLGPRHPLFSGSDIGEWTGHNGDFAFEFIDEPHKVLTLIQSARRGGTP